MKKLLALTLFCATVSMADFIGGEVNLGYYTHTPSGDISYKGNIIDTQDDMKWKQEGDIFFKAYFEHPVPLIPNLKLGYTNFTHKGDGRVDSSFTFGDVSFNSSVDIKSNFEMKMYDVALYYEILDNWLNADVGVNIKLLDGTIDVDNTVKSESADFLLPIPMAYAKFRFDVPTTGISFQAEGNYISFDEHTLYDIEAGVRYTYMFGLGIEAGYKSLKLKINDIDNLTMDTNFSGFYGKLIWDF